MQCDELFQKRQAALQQREQLEQARREMLQIARPNSNPLGDWLNNAEGRLEKAQALIETSATPQGAEGQPTNFKQLDKVLGSSAPLAGADLIGLQKGWIDSDPTSYQEYLQIHGKDVFEREMSESFAQAGYDIEADQVAEAIKRNGEPFYNLLVNQARLQAYADVTRVRLANVVGQLADVMEATGKAPTKQQLDKFLKGYALAIHAHQMRSFASRRSGQLLQNWRNMTFDVWNVEKANFDEVAKAVAEDLTSKPDPVTGEMVPNTPADLVANDSVTGRVVQAAIEGKEGVEQMREIQKTLVLDGVDPDSGLKGERWKRTYMAMARAGYKDTVLFNTRTQLVSNYISQKLVFLAEGIRQAQANPWRLLEGDNRQLGLFNPDANGFARNMFKAQLDGWRIAATASNLAEQVVQAEFMHLRGLEKKAASWKKAISDGFFGSDTPFARNIDSFNNNAGQMSVEEQYKAAADYLREPFTGGPVGRALMLRNKLHLSLKLLGNQYALNPLLNKINAGPAPVFSSLQMMQAVDNRQGMRIFLTVMANDLMIKQAKEFPNKTFKEWREAVIPQLDEMLYKSNPTDRQIKAYRDQFSIGHEISDDMIAEKIALENVGEPVMGFEGAGNAMAASIDQRMQGKQPEGSAARAIDNSVQGLRRHESFDALLSFWRSPFNSQVWDWALGAEPINAVFRLADVARAGRDATPEQMAKAQASTVMALSLLGGIATLKSMGAIIGGGPIDPQKRRQWYRNLESKGQKPNSIFGVPLGGLPLLNTLFLYSDAWDLMRNQVMSNGDMNALAGDTLALVAAQIMRTPGLKTIEQLIEVVNERTPQAAMRFASFLGNTAFNPLSGGMRDAEAGLGIGRFDIQRPEMFALRGDAGMLEPRLGPDHPMNTAWNVMRQLTYESQPALAYWAAGIPVRKQTYLGQPLRPFPQMLAGEWPNGWVGWRAGEGEFLVENQLESMGMLQPPTPLLNNTVKGVPIDVDGAEQLNRHLGEVVSDGYGSDEFSTGDVAITYKFDVDGASQQIRVQGGMKELLSKVTRGRNLRGALNELFKSKEYRALEADPALSQDPRVVSLPDRERKGRPASQLVKRLHDYYMMLAVRAFEASGSPASMQYLVDYSKVQMTEDEAITKAERLQQALQ
jgi:hypothetical protein